MKSSDRLLEMQKWGVRREVKHRQSKRVHHATKGTPPRGRSSNVPSSKSK